MDQVVNSDIGITITIILEALMIFIVDMVGPEGLLFVVNRYLTTICNNHPIINIDIIPKLDTIKANIQIITEECHGLYPLLGNMPNASDVDPTFEHITSGNEWKLYTLLAFGRPILTNVERCFATHSSIYGIDGVWNIAFSFMAPNSEVKSHTSTTKGLLQYHIPIDLSENDQCYLQIGDIRRHYHKNQEIFYDPTIIHSLVNKTSRWLVLLIVDIIRPLESFANGINRLALGLCSKHQLLDQGVINAEVLK